MESIGQILKAARERKRASLSFVASQTRIKLQFLELMERDEFGRLPAPAYAKGFLRMYAEYLGLEAKPLVQQYLEVHVGQRPPRLKSAQNEPAPAAPVPPRLPRREPAPASAPMTTPPPAAVSAEEEPAPPPRLRAPRTPWITFKKPDFSGLKKSLADWPWRTTAGVVAAVVAVVMLANGLARWARRADSAPVVVNRPLSLKKGVPAVLQDVPEPYLSLPAETTENAR